MFATALATSARPLWRLLERRGIDPDVVFRQAGLDPALMDQSRARYPLERARAAWERVVDLTGNPCVGLELSAYLQATDLHALGYAFGASSTLRTALKRVCRYVSVVNDALVLELKDVGDGVELAGTGGFGPEFRHPAGADSIWAVIVDMCRASYMEPLDPLEVSLMRPRPECAQDYVDLFRCPVRFGAAIPAILFPSSAMDRLLPARNRELARNNDRVLSGLHAALRKDVLIERVKSALIDELPSGTPSDDRIAETLFMSARTLQRRLAAEGTSFSQLLDAVRRELAEGYIQDPSLPISEIGFLLGFSELSGFSRAFKRWTGASPTAYRDRTV
jgi:AraC-like DNA-binding protein